MYTFFCFLIYWQLCYQRIVYLYISFVAIRLCLMWLDAVLM